MTAAFIIALLTACGLGLDCWAQRREIERLQEEVAKVDDDFWRADANLSDIRGESSRMLDALIAIADATRNGKSGTARMVHRMAMEGLSLAPIPVANGGTGGTTASAAMKHLVGKGTQQ